MSSNYELFQCEIFIKEGLVSVNVAVLICRLLKGLESLIVGFEENFGLVVLSLAGHLVRYLLIDV